MSYQDINLLHPKRSTRAQCLLALVPQIAFLDRLGTQNVFFTKNDRIQPPWDAEDTTGLRYARVLSYQELWTKAVEQRAM